ncbi:MAG: transcriptional regulator NrdR [Nevskiales bacterium]|nr:transcriptional regulator NrdR [Nevskiales bacterium]
MQCPFCKAEDTRVIDSRIVEDGAMVRRRRACEKCGNRFTTFEKAQLALPNILKRDGTPEPFDDDKLRKGLERALYKRPVTPEAVDHVIENIHRKLRASAERQVPSHRLGEWVMEELRDLDPVAYVRFASIYRQFQDANAFREEVERLLAFPTVEQRRSQLSLIESGDEKRKTQGGKS